MTQAEVDDVGAMVYLGSACVGMPLAAFLVSSFGSVLATALAVVFAPLGFLLLWALTSQTIHAYVPLLYLAVLALGFSTGCSFIALVRVLVLFDGLI